MMPASGGCHGCSTQAGCSRGLRGCQHTRSNWTYQPVGDAVLDGDGSVVVEIDPHVASDLTAAERAALGAWIAQGGPEVLAAVGAATGEAAVITAEREVVR